MDNKIIIIGGQTATGKTELAIKIAREFNGEVVSADSRQVYAGMDIGTGKDIRKAKSQSVDMFLGERLKRSKVKTKSYLGIRDKKNFQLVFYEINGVKIWLYDVVEPNYQFNVGEYRDLANKILKEIILRGKIPIVVGGTGLYLRSLMDSLPDISVPPDTRLRKKLLHTELRKLQQKLQEIDERKFVSLNNSDKNNPRRLIRAIEISRWKRTHTRITKKTEYEYSTIILENKPKILKEKILRRIEKRFEEGMETEVRFLLKKGYDFNLPAFSATGYREVKEYLERKINKEEAISRWLKLEIGYANKQLVWFKKFLPSGKNVSWFDSQDRHFYTRVRKLLCPFLKKQLS